MNVFQIAITAVGLNLLCSAFLPQTSTPAQIAGLAVACGILANVINWAIN